MIDEKKIEEAARKYAFDKYDSTDDEVEETYTVELQMAFEAGINWFLDNLWHDVSEVPKQDIGKITFLVVEFNDRDYKRYQIVRLLYDGGYDDIIYMNKVKRWLYLDDLLKGGNNG